MSDFIAFVSLGISSITAYLTLFHRGRLAMVRPSLIHFTSDGPDGPPKIAIHSLLYSTGPVGNVVESMYAVMHHAGKKTVYPIWTMSEGVSLGIVPGSGLIVGKAGISRYHHLSSFDETAPQRFEPGGYRVELYAVATGRYTDQLLFSVELPVPEQIGEATSLLFDRDPMAKDYQVR